jgi:hypothetical protein
VINLNFDEVALDRVGDHVHRAEIVGG